MMDFQRSQDLTDKVLHEPFDIKTHSKTFIDYLEVMIDESGKIEYAVPSHQEWLIAKLMKMNSMTRLQVYDLLKYDGCISSMCELTHCVAVWNDIVVGRPNEEQMKSICLLRDAGLLHEEEADF